ncbi:ABC transporter permease subunit [Alphaproteobacteria bacterium]|jgi:sn-glycerol 3-phosphate transport system permease protein|nr:ABC transporter permease subunit [Pelagibacteraceae bacterium]MDC0497934.1 ABC transporter permease subunit [Alphaproteobacteria bacterium]MDC3269821.1 ABC transporter permease subunit [Alphaproteobacteria bacterium]
MNNNRSFQFAAHIVLFVGVLIMVVPIWIAFASSTHENITVLSEGMKWTIGDQLSKNYNEVLNQKGGFSKEITATSMFINSFIMAFGIATVKVIISAMSAYAIVYFRFRLAVPLFWLIFITLLVPLEVRILPSYQIVSDLNLTNSYTGLVLPLVASATATFFFRQFYKSVPDELLEAAKLDGANSWKFFIDFLLPLSKTMMAAMFIFMFVYGYSQYLWPLIMTTDEKYWTVVMGMKIIFQESYEGGNLPRVAERFAYIILSMIPPVLVVVVLQRWFIKGLIQTEK